MVDAARQMLDELMGRNRNLDPSEAPRRTNWDDPEFCPYHLVKFCPHDLFVNTKADLGPCNRIHDEEAKQMYEETPNENSRKRQFETDFLRFCNMMINDVDRKIQKGKQRLQLMNRDQPAASSNQQQTTAKFQDQLSNLNARINKLLSEAEEAGIRGDVDQAQDLMTLCEQLKDEKEAMVIQYESTLTISKAPAATLVEKPDSSESHSPKSDTDGGSAVVGEKKIQWMQDLATSMQEKQMEVCETCGAFLIVGDAQQRIEDHLMGKQHLGYSKLRQAIDDIQERRKREREDERKHREDRLQRSTSRHFENDRKREYHRERGGGHRDYNRRSREHNNRYSGDRHRHHHKSHRRRSHSRGRNNHRRDSRERSRSRSRSHSRNRY